MSAWEPGVFFARRAINTGQTLDGNDVGLFSFLKKKNNAVAEAPATRLRAGDEILVLPKVDVKSRQIFKDMTQIIYQIAVAAKVVLGL